MASQAQAARNLSDENWREFLRKPMEAMYLQEKSSETPLWLEKFGKSPMNWRNIIGKSTMKQCFFFFAIVG